MSVSLVQIVTAIHWVSVCIYVCVDKSSSGRDSTMSRSHFIAKLKENRTLA